MNDFISNVKKVQKERSETLAALASLDDDDNSVSNYFDLDQRTESINHSLSGDWIFNTNHFFQIFLT